MLSPLTVFGVLLPSLLAGLVQGTAGFGSAIVEMIFFPALFGVLPAAAMNQCMSCFLNGGMVFQYRRHIRFSLVLLPLVLYFPCYLGLLLVASGLNTAFLKPVLGLFLIGMAVYLIVFSGKFTVRPTFRSALICAVISAACDAFFGIGGPPMVVYFLAVTKSKEEYFGTVQTFFLLTAVYGTIMRIWRGQLVPAMAPLIAMGVAGLLIGMLAGSRIVRHIDGEKLKKLVYAVIAAAGLITFFTNLPALLAIL